MVRPPDLKVFSNSNNLPTAPAPAWPAHNQGDMVTNINQPTYTKFRQKGHPCVAGRSRHSLEERGDSFAWVQADMVASGRQLGEAVQQRMQRCGAAPRVEVGAGRQLGGLSWRAEARPQQHAAVRGHPGYL